MERKQHVVLFHAACPDGFGAAFAAWKRMGEDADYIAVKHGEPVPDLTGAVRVTIADFSYPRDVLLKMAETIHVTVLDHHLSAKPDLEGLPFATLDMDHSGAILAWNFFHPGIAPPKLLLHVEDRDLWRWALPGSREFTSALDMYPFDFEVWDNLTHCYDQLVMEGATVFKYRRELVTRATKNVAMVTIAGHIVPCVNATLLQSDIGNDLCELYPEAPFSVSYMDRSDGVRQWSLRSKGDFDVSKIAGLFGGGGHRNASGFQTPAPDIGDPLRDVQLPAHHTGDPLG